MSKFTERFTQLNTRARVLLAVGAALALIAVVGGALLAGNPPLLTRLMRTLSGATLQSNNDGRIMYRGLCLSATTEWLGVSDHKYLVRLWECDPANPGNQTWTHVGDGFIAGKTPYGVTICLDVEGASTAADATVTTFPCKRTDRANQEWTILGLGFLDQVVGNGIQIQNDKSGMCLTPADTSSSHSYIVQQSCNQAVEWVWPPNYVPKSSW